MALGGRKRIESSSRGLREKATLIGCSVERGSMKWLRSIFLFTVLGLTTFGGAQKPTAFLTVNAGSDSWSVVRVPCEGFPAYPEIKKYFPVEKECPILGETTPETKTVYVLEGQAPADEKTTVLHELMHVAVGVNFSLQIMMGHDAIYDISEKLSPILANNPQLLKYLAK